MDKFPARLHVLFARESPFAVVIRRGPSKQVCTIGWDRRKDKFSIGQWLKGKIYERRSDISPNGQYLIYFAMNGKWYSEVQGSWTAISKAPYLKAVGLWAKGDCWHGGGLFLSNTEFWLNELYAHELLQAPPNDLTRIKGFPFKTYYGGIKAYCSGKILGVYYQRLQRDGWNLLEVQKIEKGHSVGIFEKPINRYWNLRKMAHSAGKPAHGKGCDYEEHQLVHIETGEILNYPDWEWAEMDNKRLVWAEKGQIFSGKVTHAKVKNQRKLYDFNDMVFEPLKAPY